MQIKWEKAPQWAGWKATMSDNVTLVVTPNRLARSITPRPARGTMWHAQASHWCEATSTMSRYGRDEYDNLQPSAAAAMLLAERIYNDARMVRP